MDEENVPSRDECIQRIDDFVEATKSNSAIAQEFLQNCDWDLNRAVLGFFEAVEKENEDEIVELDDADNVVEKDKEIAKKFTDGKILTSVPPPSLRLLSWNLDCMDVNSLKLRMKSVVKTLQKIEPDVVFFQEVLKYPIYQKKNLL